MLLHNLLNYYKGIDKGGVEEGKRETINFIFLYFFYFLYFFCI